MELMAKAWGVERTVSGKGNCKGSIRERSVGLQDLTPAKVLVRNGEKQGGVERCIYRKEGAGHIRF